MRYRDLRQTFVAGVGVLVMLPVENLLRSRSALRLGRLVHFRQHRDIGWRVKGGESLAATLPGSHNPAFGVLTISLVTCARLQPSHFPDVPSSSDPCRSGANWHSSAPGVRCVHSYSSFRFEALNPTSSLPVRNASTCSRPVFAVLHAD